MCALARAREPLPARTHAPSRAQRRRRDGGADAHARRALPRRRVLGARLEAARPQHHAGARAHACTRSRALTRTHAAARTRAQREWSEDAKYLLMNEAPVLSERRAQREVCVRMHARRCVCACVRLCASQRGAALCASRRPSRRTRCVRTRPHARVRTNTRARRRKARSHRRRGVVRARTRAPARAHAKRTRTHTHTRTRAHAQGRQRRGCHRCET
jgi:hypothetical protein